MVDLDELRQADEKLTDRRKRENVIRLAFGGDRERFEEFCRVLDSSYSGKYGGRAWRQLRHRPQL